MAAPKLPNTEPYRVCIAGATYQSPKIEQTFDGTEKVIYVSLLGLNGEEIQLTDREAHRLKGLGAVKPADEPLSYEEMTTKQLDDAVKAAGIPKVVSSGADPDKPLHTDKINALRTYDQGRGVAGAAPATPVGLTAPTPPAAPTPELAEEQQAAVAEEQARLTALSDEDFAAYVQEGNVADLTAAVKGDDALTARLVEVESLQGDDARKGITALAK